MSDASPIRIDTGDLYSPQVNEFVEMQQALRRETGPINPQPLIIRVIYSSWFYLSIASGLGAFLASRLPLEPFFDEDSCNARQSLPVAVLILFPTVAGRHRAVPRRGRRHHVPQSESSAAICGLVGLGIGFGGGLVSDLMIGERVYRHFCANRREHDEPVPPRPGGMPTGLALLVLMMGRGAAWAIAAIPAGIGQGVALREKKVIVNGLVGGVLGGLVGGLLFDPICLIFNKHETATVSRAVGLTIIGLSVGLFVGLVEGWTKTAWLLMRAGPLAGKQFVMFRDTTVLGSSPKAEIYLFKDEAIEPRHALIYNRGGRFEIEDCNSRDGTYVNGVPVRRQILKHGDQVVLGKTVLEFQLKESKAT